MNTESASTIEIAPGTKIATLLSARPHLRSVLDRYGLRGCGGPHGPAETIGHFARAHRVELDSLLQELRAANSVPYQCNVVEVDSVADPRDAFADTIYRRFFKAGIVVVLTAGAVWGAWLLLRIAYSGSFTALSIHEINAHGHAQIFGWVGLFVMGVAYRVFPSLKNAALWRPDLALLTLGLMIVGIAARVIGEPLHEMSALRALAIGGAVIEVLALVLFTHILWRSVRTSLQPTTWADGYIVAAVGFLIIQAVYELALLVATTGAASREALLDVIATWQAPLRDLQIHGFALLMILGVALRLFPVFFGLSSRGHRLPRNALIVLLLAILGEVNAFLAMRLTGNYAWGGVLYLCILLLAGACFALTWRWLPIFSAARADRSAKFVQTGVLWLHVSLLLLVLAPLQMFVVLPSAPWLSESGVRAVEIHFSHAYYGAIRHAITVGFVSLTIMGMAAKLVPRLARCGTQELPGLWLPFMLVNAGCALRVALQIGTDFSHGAFLAIGISGVLEVAGLAAWAVRLWGELNRLSSRDRAQVALA